LAAQGPLIWKNKGARAFEGGRMAAHRRLQLINGILNYLSLIKYAAGALFLENNRRSNTDIIDIAGSNRSQSQMAER
jgi:hypothetical protein